MNLRTKLDPLNLISKFGAALSPLINLFEKSKIKHYSSSAPKYHPIFIIGAPRSGSTILYQLLTNTFELLYIDNISHLFYKNLYFGLYLSQLLYNDRAHNTYKSNHGTTYRQSWHGPSECPSFWYRWLTKQKHYIAQGEIEPETIETIKKNIYAIINRYKKPFIFKNLPMGMRIGLIHDFAPSAKFIFIKREPAQNAYSIWRSRKNRRIKDDGWWSVKPKNFKEINKLQVVEKIVKQIYYINKQILIDSKLFPVQNLYCLSYEELCEKTETILAQLHNFFENAIPKRKNTQVLSVVNESKQIPDDVLKMINREVNSLDWTN